jgi:transcriptional regulator with PAS, ATPase and Fis domain
MNKPNTVTPHPYRVARQADQLEQREITGSWLDARMDRFMRNILVRALRKHGNKVHAAKALGVTYRTFRYHWSRLLNGDAK